MHVFLRLMVLLLLVTGCAEEAATALTGTSESDATVQDAGLKADVADASQPDAQAIDVQLDSAADTAVADVAPDVAVQDVQPDVQVVDVQADVAKPDVQPDTTKDTSIDPCASKLSSYANVRNQALNCTSPFQCWQAAPASAQCADCNAYFNGESMDTQNMTDMLPDLKKSNCTGPCNAACADMTRAVGVCSNGTCATKELTCKELDTAATAALAEGAKCTQDSDCKFKVSNTLGCGCPTFVNVTTMGPAKPLFNYMIMLVKAYKAKTCTSDVTCACADPQSAKCVAGVCVGQ